MAGDLARILTRRLELAEGGEAQLPILFRLAQIAEKDLDDTEMATIRYEAILAIEPSLVGALDALIRLSSKPARSGSASPR